MSGIGGGRAGNANITTIGQTHDTWGSTLNAASNGASLNEINLLEMKVGALGKHIEQLTKRIEQLETAYMEIKLLGKDLSAE